MSAIRSAVGVITLFQRDLDEAKAFYSRLFAKAPAFASEDVAVFQLDNTILNLVGDAAGRERIAPAPVAAPDAGSRGLLAIWVDDLDAACAELAKRGIKLLNGPRDTPWGTRNAHFADPSGHIWGIAQDLEPQPGG